jgi:arylsulfatase A-like enzyme
MFIRLIPTALISLRQIAFNDSNFGALIRELERRNLYDESLIILTSDHGEAFNEHGSFEHGKTLYSELIHVPLIIKFPAGRAAPKGEIRLAAQHVDILPTILDCVGLEIPSGVEGQSLIALSSQLGAENQPRKIFSHMDLDGRRATSVIEGPWKLVRRDLPNGSHAPIELYDMELDAAEQTDLSHEHPTVARYLLSQIMNHESSKGQIDQRETLVNEELRQKLRALGYLY